MTYNTCDIRSVYRSSFNFFFIHTFIKTLIESKSSNRRDVISFTREKNIYKFTSIFSKDTSMANEFEEKYGDRYTNVSQYYFATSEKVEIVSMKDVAPTLFL